MEKKIITIIKGHSRIPAKKYKTALTVSQGIHIFVEKPCMAKFGIVGEKPVDHEACDLFSLFTANIIQEKRVFTR